MRKSMQHTPGAPYPGFSDSDDDDEMVAATDGPPRAPVTRARQ